LRGEGKGEGVWLTYELLSKYLDWFSWFSAQISALDLVISVDNSTVHIAGALGIPTWTLLPFDCDWRWFLKCRDYTPWYQTMRLFRQKIPGDWAQVIDRVCKSLMEIQDR